MELARLRHPANYTTTLHKKENAGQVIQWTIYFTPINKFQFTYTLGWPNLKKNISKCVIIYFSENSLTKFIIFKHKVLHMFWCLKGWVGLIRNMSWGCVIIIFCNMCILKIMKGSTEIIFSVPGNIFYSHLCSYYIFKRVVPSTSMLNVD